MTVVEDWFSANRATFGDRLAAAREAAGMTQEGLADRLGIRPEVLDGWEHDLAEPPTAILRAIEEVLGQPVDWLVTGEGDGLSGPVEGPGLAATLEELGALRAKMQELAAELARVEDRLKGLLNG